MTRVLGSTYQLFGRIVAKEAQDAINVAMDIFSNNKSWKSLKDIRIHNKVKGTSGTEKTAYWKSETMKQEDLIQEFINLLSP